MTAIFLTNLPLASLNRLLLWGCHRTDGVKGDMVDVKFDANIKRDGGNFEMCDTRN